LIGDRKDVVPLHIVREMEKLQDNVPFFPAEQAINIIETSLKQPIDSLFLRFDKIPDAAASLSQVHRAILPTGRPVAVKIKRPGIDLQIEADIKVMQQIAHFLDNSTPYFKVVTAQELVEAFAMQIRKEIDFVEEFFNLKKFRKLYHNDKTIIVPYVYDEYARHDVLVMEYIHGKKISDVINDKDSRFDLKKINRINSDFLMSQLFLNDYFHADPHPGNFLLVEGNKICYVDYGMVYSLQPYELENLNFMIIGLGKLDPSMISYAILRMGKAVGKVDSEVFETALQEFIDSYLDRPMEYIDVAKALFSLMQIILRFKVHVPPHFIYIVKVLGTLQSISSGLDPDFNIISYLNDFSPKMWANQLGSKQTGNKILLSGLNWTEMALQTPELFFDMRRFLNERNLTINAPEVDKMRETFDKVGFRLVFGLVLSSLLISSSLIVLADINPKVYGIPLIGIIGYAVGAIMGMVFLFAGIKKLFSWHYRE
jgi:ubiquinone biosynthesis protein